MGPPGAVCAAGLLPGSTGPMWTRHAGLRACLMPLGTLGSPITRASGCTPRSSEAGMPHASHAG
eukprot:304824-Alexandrium_andersonii.AAC.1